MIKKLLASENIELKIWGKDAVQNGRRFYFPRRVGKIGVGKFLLVMAKGYDFSVNSV
ncbi:hypothetical protein [uncultured Sanguibacteroides sp.]|uniref:hypothetical protein n=1 Tax=uncultured Sanguibacteroides sp. TaxID=1635151 RepID=UPI0025DC2657|nr:hypothetical protein [uncultured Sanguibacteroides sp.]